MGLQWGGAAGAEEVEVEVEVTTTLQDHGQMQMLPPRTIAVCRRRKDSLPTITSQTETIMSLDILISRLMDIKANERLVSLN